MAARGTCFLATTLPNFLTTAAPATTNKLLPVIVASAANRRKKINGSPSKPSVAEVERAIGAGTFRGFSSSDPTTSSQKEKTNPTTLLEVLESLPIIGREESPTEKKLREAAEWMVRETEGKGTRSVQETMLLVCVKILPVWLFFLLIASGLIKLPFSIPLLDDYLM